MAEASHPLVRNSLAEKPPIAKLIGFEIEDVSEGHAIGLLQARPEHANPMGTLHGGVLCDLTDAAMGMAFASTLAAEESFTTVALTINFFRPVWRSRLRAEARVISRGKNIGYVECDVTDEGENALQRLPRPALCCVVIRRNCGKRQHPDAR